MKIAFVAARVPYPLNAGNRIRTFHLLDAISQVHDVTLLTAIEGDGDREALTAMQRRIPRLMVRVAEVPPRNTLGRRLLRALRNPFDPLPYTWAGYRDPRFAENLRVVLGHDRFDLVHCDHIQVAHAVLSLPAAPRLLNAHNVENVLLRRVAQQSSPPMKILLAWQAGKTLRAELRTVPLFDACVTVSEVDRAVIQGLAPSLPVSVVPNGVNTDWFTPRSRVSGAPLLLFTGALDWLPNRDAVRFFARSVLPAIRIRVPSAEFWVVGRNPSPSLARGVLQDGVRLVGTVEDVRPYMARARLFVVPLRIGGGTRLKILEAWAMGKPVLSTSIGAEGLPAFDGTNIALADTPGAIAERAVTLLTNERLAEEIGLAGRRTVEHHFSWKLIATRLLDAYDVAIAAAADRRGRMTHQADRSAVVRSRAST